MPLPHAALAYPTIRRRIGRWLDQRLSPPSSLITSSGFSSASHWSLTGALAAGFALGLYFLLVSGNIWHADFTLTVGWAIFATFGVVFWFWPFLASFYMYMPLHRLLSGRISAAVYGALWHTAAHCALVDGLGSEAVNTSLLVPLVVGALWGSWLPAAVAPAVRR